MKASCKQRDDLSTVGLVSIGLGSLFVGFGLVAGLLYVSVDFVTVALPLMLSLI